MAEALAAAWAAQESCTACVMLGASGGKSANKANRPLPITKMARRPSTKVVPVRRFMAAYSLLSGVWGD
jgi:hypothetical protein